MAFHKATLEKLGRLDYAELCQRYADGESYESLTPADMSVSTIRGWMQEQGHEPISGRRAKETLAGPAAEGARRSHDAVIRVAVPRGRWRGRKRGSWGG